MLLAHSIEQWLHHFGKYPEALELSINQWPTSQNGARCNSMVTEMAKVGKESLRYQIVAPRQVGTIKEPCQQEGSIWACGEGDGIKNDGRCHTFLHDCYQVRLHKKRDNDIPFGTRWLVSFPSTSADTLLHIDLRLLPAVCPRRRQI